MFLSKGLVNDFFFREINLMDNSTVRIKKKKNLLFGKTRIYITRIIRYLKTVLKKKKVTKKAFYDKKKSHYFTSPLFCFHFDLNSFTSNFAFKKLPILFYLFYIHLVCSRPYKFGVWFHLFLNILLLPSSIKLYPSH